MADETITLGRAALTADQAAAIPPIAAGYTLKADGDGRVYLHHRTEGADWYCIPRPWRDLRYRPESGEIGDMNVSANYGVNTDAIHQSPGTIQTNDPALMPEALLATAATPAEQCPAPVPAPAPGTSTDTLGLAVVLIGAALLVILFGRRRS